MGEITLPTVFANWFAARGWHPRAHQQALWAETRAGNHALLIAPTGGGKTLAGFLPSLIGLADGPESRTQGLHTVYVSPLKALAVDSQRNLMVPVEEMGLDIRIETRTGDTPPNRKQRQKTHPPQIMLTTPEQIALMLSWRDAPSYFAGLRHIIIDELHALYPNKRGDLLALGLAFLGGLILNAMPCVFPILSLKVLSFATGDPGEHRRHGLAYLTGVVASFVLIASVLISLQSAGRWVGWGFQLQSTGFVIGLAYLFAVMGLSLSGLVLFGGRWMNLGAGLATAPGARGSFFTGVLAVVVASPCTAPFMGSALGYALTQPAFAALAVFAALGVGMATPMVAISMSDTARRWLPKPGVWMETLKQVMAFPLYLTAVWLLWVAGKQSGVDTMAAAAAGLVMLALGLTLIRGGATARVVGLICMVSAVMLGGVRGDATASSGKEERDGIVAWSPERLQTLRAQGTPVFVDVTADWCITCLANEQAVLFTDDMTRAFETAGVTYMVADWTNYDPDIGAFVREHGRNGIPLYVMYPGNLSGAPTLLPQLLTANIVAEALASVSR